MTRPEIERRINAGGLTAAEVADLWEGYYLTVDEVGEFLPYIKAEASQPWVYPMVCFAVPTGSRRSEMLPCECASFESMIVAKAVLVSHLLPQNVAHV